MAKCILSLSIDRFCDHKTQRSYSQWAANNITIQSFLTEQLVDEISRGVQIMDYIYDRLRNVCVLANAVKVWSREFSVGYKDLTPGLHW